MVLRSCYRRLAIDAAWMRYTACCQADIQCNANAITRCGDVSRSSLSFWLYLELLSCAVFTSVGFLGLGPRLEHLEGRQYTRQINPLIPRDEQAMWLRPRAHVTETKARPTTAESLDKQRTPTKEYGRFEPYFLLLGM
jgi:hypothetical protein